MTTNNPDARADAARMLELIQSQRRSTQRRLLQGYTVLLLVWAAAWAIGFGALWFTDGVGGAAVLPTPVGWTIFGACIVGAIVWSIITGVRSGASGIVGRSRLQGMLYGWSWTISMMGTWLLLVALQRAGMPPSIAALLYPGAFVLMVGVLYLAGGALWRSPVQYVLGIVMIVVVIVATFAGSPLHYLVYATAGPLAMVVVAVLLARGVVPLEPRREATHE